MRPEVNINLDDDEEPKEIKKNKFWHALNIGQKKLTIIFGIIVTLGGLGRAGFFGVDWVKEKIINRIDKDSRESTRTQRRHGYRIDSICVVIDSMKMEMSDLKKEIKNRRTR